MPGQPRDQNLSHYPVLYQEIIHALRPHSEGFFVDCTIGAGGHAFGILEASAPTGRLLGFDLDPDALALSRERLKSFGSRLDLIRASYTTLGRQLQRQGWPKVHGVLFDLGVSSMQLRTAIRGFSFRVSRLLLVLFELQYGDTFGRGTSDSDAGERRGALTAAGGPSDQAR